MTHKRMQADSLFLDFPVTDWQIIDPTWSNWSGLWVITDVVSGDILLSGSLLQSSTAGTLCLRLGPWTTPGWSTWPVGTYSLSVEVNNESANFRREQNEKLLILPQEVPNV